MYKTKHRSALAVIPKSIGMKVRFLETCFVFDRLDRFGSGGTAV